MQTFVGGANAILLLLTVVFSGFLPTTGLLAWRRRNSSALRAVTVVGVLVVGIYTALLLSAALASKQRVLAAGQVKWFCGFYLDCHLGVSVTDVASAKNLVGDKGPIVAKGRFRIVTVEFHNSARNRSLNMTFYHPLAAIVDASGRRYERSPEAEQAVAHNPIYATPLAERVSVGHTPLFATLVFDIPADTPDPKLSLEEGFIVDRTLELVLVNDDNSLFHQPTYLALGDASGLAPTSYLRNEGVPVPRVRLASR